LREHLRRGPIVPFIGIYDVFSASLAARHFDALFVSGFGLAASQYGLPDVGFVSWPDILNFVQRVRAIVPDHHLLVDIDDGYCDTDVACHVARSLEELGASGIVLEDQARPRGCGHLEGKRILPLDEYLAKLEAVLASRCNLFVVARTDATDADEIKRRVVAFRQAGCDAVLADGVPSLELLSEISGLVDCPVVVSQIAGGKSPICSLTELQSHGASMVIYSTPCLFAAQAAVEGMLHTLKAEDGSLGSAMTRDAILKTCNEVLRENLDQRAPRAK
jgi:2-methylisocitrate lyase-like PEP mutase family enzyme